MKKPTLLMILDGFGCRAEKHGNAVLSAKTPYLDQIFTRYPHTTLGASGLEVGLPEGQMGNSEVGHLNIGAGRVVYQELTRISKAIQNQSFFSNEAFIKAAAHVKKHDSALHIMGLLSDGGVHSHISHITALLDFAKSQGLTKVYVHGFLDGRDVPPRCAIKYIDILEDHIRDIGLGAIASISGRYYAMDRDNRWDRVALAYDALSLGKGAFAPNPSTALEQAYDREENDEFVTPTVILTDDQPIGTICEHDAVIMFNFRPDRAREITRCFVDKDFSGFQRPCIYEDLFYVSMTQYDAKMPNVTVAFPPSAQANTLGEHVSSLGLTQLRIAETEKYAHVTFFFNGGVEAPNKNEDRILVPSPKVATYDLQPEMSASLVTEKVTEAIANGKYDLIILNYANPDMVGHTGNMDATIKAMEAVDLCVHQVFDAIKKAGGQIVLTADHGNAEFMLDEDDGPFTAHSLSRVPFLITSDDNQMKLRKDGILADIAPTLLSLMGLPTPIEMTGRDLKV